MKKSIKTRYVVIALILILVISCSGDGENGLGLSEWLEQPITELSIGELIILLVVVGFAFS